MITLVGLIESGIPERTSSYGLTDHLCPPNCSLAFLHASNSVLGGGTNGICTGLALAKRKLNVAVVEQFSRDHQRGSSHGHSRITRYLVGQDFLNVFKKAFSVWQK